jgi:hypothetical protein
VLLILLLQPKNASKNTSKSALEVIVHSRMWKRHPPAKTRLNRSEVPCRLHLISISLERVVFEDVLSECRVLERFSLLRLGFWSTFSCRVSSGIRKEFRAKNWVIGEVGDKGPSPLGMLYPLDVGWLLGNNRGSRLSGWFWCNLGRGSFLAFWHLIHTAVWDG